MPKDVLITPANGVVEFKDTSGNVDATIQLDDLGNLNITNPGGSLSVGDVTSNVYIGDGAAVVDIVFEQNGSVRALTGKTLTLGQSDSSISVVSPTTFANGIIKSTNSNSPDTSTGIKFGRDGSQYYTFHGGSSGNFLTSISTSGNPKDGYIAASRNSGSTFREYRFSSDTYNIYAGANTVWHQGNDGSGSGLDADTVDGIQGSDIVTTTTITNFTLNPKFFSTIGFSNDTEVLFYNDATSQTRSGYWTLKDGFEIRGDGNSKDAVVLQTGHLELTQNAWVEKNIGIGGNFIANGNVGIGTTPTTFKLDVAGTGGAAIRNAGGSAFLEIGVGATGNNFAYIDLTGDTTYTDYGLRLIRGAGGPNTESSIDHRGTGSLIIRTTEAGPITFHTTNAERLRIVANGWVGIGTTSPAATLHVVGNVGANTYTTGQTTASISSGTLTINLNTGTVFVVTLNANITTLTISNLQPSSKTSSFVLLLVGDGTSRAITWPASFKFPSNTAPTITSTLNKVSIVTAFTYDAGTNWYAILSGSNF